MTTPTPPTPALLVTPEWTYSRYRAMLRRNGQSFAIVTPDHANALTEDDAKILLDALNRPASDAKLVEALKNLESATIKFFAGCNCQSQEDEKPVHAALEAAHQALAEAGEPT